MKQYLVIAAVTVVTMFALNYIATTNASLHSIIKGS